MKVVVIDYGAGNVQSVMYALNRLNIEASLSNDPDEIKKADKLIFPGVGAAGAAMKELKKFGLDTLIPNLTQPFLGICLGMQIMCPSSEENDTDCLGVIDTAVKRFESDEEKVPHMGWNNVRDRSTLLFDGVSDEQMYFVHSYYVPLGDYTIGTCDYIIPFSAALKKDNFYATQFHPEKSGGIGELILKNFIEKA